MHMHACTHTCMRAHPFPPAGYAGCPHVDFPESLALRPLPNSTTKLTLKDEFRSNDWMAGGLSKAPLDFKREPEATQDMAASFVPSMHKVANWLTLFSVKSQIL